MNKYFKEIKPSYVFLTLAILLFVAELIDPTYADRARVHYGLLGLLSWGFNRTGN